MSTRDLGNRGEQIAAGFLKNKGYQLVTANFENNKGYHLGEIDLIAKEKDEWVFVEVKTRRASANYDEIYPEESITRRKLYKLGRIIEAFLIRNNLLNCNYRLDAVCVILNTDGDAVKIRHLKNIFI